MGQYIEGPGQLVTSAANKKFNSRSTGDPWPCQARGTGFGGIRQGAGEMVTGAAKKEQKNDRRRTSPCHFLKVLSIPRNFLEKLAEQGTSAH